MQRTQHRRSESWTEHLGRLDARCAASGAAALDASRDRASSERPSRHGTSAQGQIDGRIIGYVKEHPQSASASDDLRSYGPRLGTRPLAPAKRELGPTSDVSLPPA